MKMMKNKKPKLKLIGEDGNAFAILGLARRAGLKAGWSKERLDAFLKNCMGGDYNHLLKVVQEYFDVS